MPPTSPGTRRSLTLALSRSTLSFDGLLFRGAWAPAASQAISGRRLYAALDKALSSGEFGQRSGSGSSRQRHSAPPADRTAAEFPSRTVRT